jgi:AraC family transcriptional activator of pobA
MRHFSRLIESHYREHLPLAEYARQVGAVGDAPQLFVS